MSPRVSVVVPTFNNAAFVAETIETILTQSYSSFELVIADHASQDGTWSILQRYSSDPRVRLTQTDAGGGAQRNWNRVSAAARGEWIKLVCGDDLLLPSGLATQLAAVDETDAPDAVALVASPRKIIDAKGRQVFASVGLAGLRGLVEGRTAIRHAVRRGTNIFGEPCCTLLRRNVLEEVGWWDGTYGYLIDESTYLRMLLRGNLLALPETVAAFRLSSSQWSVRLANQQARQAAAVHRELLKAAPGVVSKADVALGDAQAHARAVQRRLAYAWLRRRMTPAKS